MSKAKLRIAVSMLVLLLSFGNLSPCWSLNIEGEALLRLRDGVVRDPHGALRNWEDDGVALDPCSWFGVECSDDGLVIVLDLRDQCLEGTLTAELGKLANIKSIILRNNSFSGNIPDEIAQLKELEVLDLGYNNFSGSFPSELGNNLSLTTLLVDNNEFLDCASPALHELMMISESQADEKQFTNIDFNADCNTESTSWGGIYLQSASNRRQILGIEVATASKRHGAKNHKKSEASPSPAPTLSSPAHAPSSPSMPPMLHSPTPSHPPLRSPKSSFVPSPSPSVAPQHVPRIPSATRVTAHTPASVPQEHPHVVAPPEKRINAPSPVSNSEQDHSGHSKGKNQALIISLGVIGGSLVMLFLAAAIVFSRGNKMVTVKPWATGLSGQLQKAFVTGVPKLNRSELEAACEDFSNIIGTLSDGTVYKGTLSSGVEIAVTSTTVASPDGWSKHLEAQFRNKIATLSRVNHKNFLNLVGFCEEEKPFTRMMVFEYAPNGTLFEHLHIKEAEHLDWGARLRIIMGISYCLEYMHDLTPPVAHRNLHSTSVYLTEDYAAKLSDCSLCNDLVVAKIGSDVVDLLETPSVDPQSNVYGFGVILFEIITGRIPYSMDNGFLIDWISKCIRGEMPPKEMADPSLRSYQGDVLQKLLEVMKECLHPEPKQRPRMREITAKLKAITTMEPDAVTPKLSPLWWAELEIMSTASSEEVKSEPPV